MTMENKVVPANTNPVDVSQGTSVEIETSAIEQQIHDQVQAQGVSDGPRFNQRRGCR